MRSLVAVLTILLLAAAGAAGAGDKIKWERAKKLTYVTPGNETPSAVGDPKEILEQYKLSWSNSHGKDIYEITATYVAWDFLYAILSESFAAGYTDLEEFTAGLEKGREYFENNIKFVVTVLADEEKHARLSNRLYWEVYLADGGEKIPPAEIEFSESAFEEALLRAFYEAGLGSLIIRSKKNYVVTFANPYKTRDPASIKLILLCDDCRRGFEWRFKQD